MKRGAIDMFATIVVFKNDKFRFNNIVASPWHSFYAEYERTL